MGFGLPTPPPMPVVGIHGSSSFSGRGQPYQEKPETAEYRVVYSPTVAVRDKPWGAVIGSRKTGEMVRTCARSVGLVDGTWVKTAEPASAGVQPGWMLVDGRAINLPKLLEKVEKGRKGMVVRYKVLVATTDIRERPALAGTPVVGARKRGAIIRTDQELNGWVRLQHDFYQTGSAEPCEGWAMVHGRSIGQGLILQTWEPTDLPAAVIGGLGALGGQTSRLWVMAAEGAAVRERPWGRVLCVKRRGVLLRCDTIKDGWARLEADFTEDGPLESADGFDEDSQVLEGWVLLDGRDLGLPRQLQKRDGEKVPPAEEPRKSAAELRARRTAKRAAHAERGADQSLAAILGEAKVSPEVSGQLDEAGVDDVEELITIVSRGDFHDELKKCGIGKLGARAKLATLVQPYWKALTYKEQGNAQYKDSRFEDAANLYTKAIQLIPCASTDLALNCYSNRAACFQQMREPKLALTDVEHVLTYDPTNAKALARQQVYKGQVASGL